MSHSTPDTPSPPPGRPDRRDDRAVVYFVSDVHLGGSPPEEERRKRDRLDGLLDRVERDDASLYVLGDLFDFWFEYRTVVPRTALGLLARLDGMARARPVAYLGGNHDFWMRDFLARETRIEVLEDGVTLHAQGRRARLFHGDGLGPGDTGYKLLKRVLRNPLAVRLYRWIHPDLGIPLALKSSGVSRGHAGDRKVDVESLFRHVAEPEFRRDADAVLMGHHHVAVHLERAAGEMLILGDWFEKYTCVRLTAGKFSLLTWPLPD